MRPFGSHFIISFLILWNVRAFEAASVRLKKLVLQWTLSLDTPRWSMNMYTNKNLFSSIMIQRKSPVPLPRGRKNKSRKSTTSIQNPSPDFSDFMNSVDFACGPFSILLRTIHTLLSMSPWIPTPQAWWRYAFYLSVGSHTGNHFRWFLVLYKPLLKLGEIVSINQT